MNLFEDALNKSGIKSVDFKDVQIDEEKTVGHIKLELCKKRANLYNKGASEKELHQFAIKHGFLSAKHLNLYVSLIDVAQKKREEVDIRQIVMSEDKYKVAKKRVEDLKYQADSMKDPWHYKVTMRALDQQDISPYGEDVLQDTYPDNEVFFDSLSYDFYQ